MRDDREVSPGVRRGQRAHRGEHAAAELAQALAAAGQREVGVVPLPARPQVGVALLHLRQLQPFEDAEVLLAKAGLRPHRQPPGARRAAPRCRARAAGRC